PSRRARPSWRALAVGILVLAGLSAARAQDDGPSVLKLPRGELWLVLPQGWSGSADGASGRLDLASAAKAASVTVVAFPNARSDAEILEAVKDRFAHLATGDGASGIAWETSALAAPKVLGSNAA